jgi:hypothetical protein
MRVQKVIFLTGFFSAVMLLGALAGWTQSGPETKGPIITNCYAVDKGRYGTIWRIYIEAEAAGTDMSQIAVVVDQPGRGRYPTDFILLDPQHRHHLKGYLQWNTFSSKSASLKEGDQITLRVSVIDRARKESKAAVFPFTFMSVSQEEVLPSPFDQDNIPRLGHIGIDLMGPGGDF